ncbi:hypothetical protein CYMTET_33910 [Cymbomonas tetramitiformis]|uniref:Uncharacterized protein n=1 Tax=Cymbomonas tetramitiformis TaxID=36881 RepID=A0AAE0FC30_9CHLO|nr:hypothetical protein CYMTET_33910 [Cymbomonas tetramitiformis]
MEEYRDYLHELEPNFEYIYFTVKKIISELYADPEFLAALKVDFLDPTDDMWRSLHYQEVNRQSGGKLFSINNGAYELTVDWVKPFETVDTYSLDIACPVTLVWNEDRTRANILFEYYHPYL